MKNYCTKELILPFGSPWICLKVHIPSGSFFNTDATLNCRLAPPVQHGSGRSMLIVKYTFIRWRRHMYVQLFTKSVPVPNNDLLFKISQS